MDVLTVLSIGLICVTIVMAVVMTIKHFKTKAQTKVLQALATTARERLSEVEAGTVNAGQGAIDSALVRRDESSLRAFANLMGKHPSFDIVMAVFTVEFMRIGKKPAEVSITPESLTSEQVTIYSEVTRAIGDGINLSSIIENNGNRVAYYAMEHLSDYPAIISIISKRGIKELDQIKEVLAEMKLSQSAALAEGSL